MVHRRVEGNGGGGVRSLGKHQLLLGLTLTDGGCLGNWTFPESKEVEKKVGVKLTRVLKEEIQARLYWAGGGSEKK